jgi:ATP-binding cassette, subfamily F, member 3
MSWIIAENVTQAYGTQVVLERISARIGPEDRIGLVGPNGEGKTTLLKALGRLMEVTEGKISHRRGLRVGYLPQETPALTGATIRSQMLEIFADQRQREHRLRELSEAVSAGGADLQNNLARLGLCQGEFDAAGGYQYLTRIEQVLTGLGFDESMWDRPMAQLSGGQRTRAYLASLLLAEPDVLMLDEPTNHLDIASVEWLEEYLCSFRKALVVVSHDRYFLDRVTASTWEVAFGQLETYPGSYSAFLPLRQQRQLERLRRWQAQQEYVQETQEFIRRHLAGQRTKEAQGRRTRLERFLRDEAVAKPREHKGIHLDISSSSRTGDWVLRAEDLAAGYEAAKPLLSLEQLEVSRGQRVAIVGANGTGKTTLLRTLLGELPALAGRVRYGANVKLGYLSQTQSELEPSATALESLTAGGLCRADRARDLLGSLLLSGDDAFKKVSELSGGQRARLVLARLALHQPSVLMLDEPTNHLDIPTTEVIQDLLLAFAGTVIFVSHDRYLIQAVATHIWVIEGGQVVAIPGGWDRFLQ